MVTRVVLESCWWKLCGTTESNEVYLILLLVQKIITSHPNHTLLDNEHGHLLMVILNVYIMKKNLHHNILNNN